MCVCVRACGAVVSFFFGLFVCLFARSVQIMLGVSPPASFLTLAAES